MTYIKTINEKLTDDEIINRINDSGYNTEVLSFKGQTKLNAEMHLRYEISKITTEEMLKKTSKQTHINIMSVKIPIKRVKGLITLSLTNKVDEQINEITNAIVKKAYKEHKAIKSEKGEKVIFIPKIPLNPIEECNDEYLGQTRVRGLKLVPKYNKPLRSGIKYGIGKITSITCYYPVAHFIELVIGSFDENKPTTTIRDERYNYVLPYSTQNNYLKPKTYNKNVLKGNCKGLKLYLPYVKFSNWTEKHNFFAYELKSINHALTEKFMNVKSVDEQKHEQKINRIVEKV